MHSGIGHTFSVFVLLIGLYWATLKFMNQCFQKFAIYMKLTTKIDCLVTLCVVHSFTHTHMVSTPKRANR